MNAPLKWLNRGGGFWILALLLLIFVWVLAACASQPPPHSMTRLSEGIDGQALDFKLDPAAPLGAIVGSGANPAAADLVEYGLAIQAKPNLTLDGVVASGRNVVFLDTTKEIFWFALFGMRGSLKNTFSRTFRVEWYAPKWTLYHHQKFKSGLINDAFAKTTLRLPQPIPESLVGRWRVRVWKKNALLDDRYFEIVKA